ncbi:MAG: trypsin-like peptidase domain-containing protein [Saprospiraceae bacterium]
MKTSRRLLLFGLKFIPVFLCSCLLSCTANPVQEDQIAIAKIELIEGNNGVILSSGTCFFLRGGLVEEPIFYLATAKHVVGKGDGVDFQSYARYIRVKANWNPPNKVEDEFIINIANNRPSRRLNYGNEQDWLLYRVFSNETQDSTLYTYLKTHQNKISSLDMLRGCENVKIGQTAYLSGFPIQSYYDDAKRYKASIDTISGKVYEIDCMGDKISINAPVAKGHSGCPVYTDDGNGKYIIGLIVKFVFTNEDGEKVYSGRSRLLAIDELLSGLDVE